MTPNLYTHALDPTGRLLENKIEWEPVTLSNRTVRAIVPEFGAFFDEDSLIIRERDTQRILTRGVHYYPGELYTIPSMKYGKQIYAVIIVTDPAVLQNLEMTYQCLGGPWGYSNAAIIQVFEQLQDDNRPVTWGNIIGKPSEFPPAHHLQDIGDLYGAEYIVAALERLSQAILMGDSASHDEIYRYIDALHEEQDGAIEALEDYLREHIEDKNNPHETTAHQVGTLTEQEIRDLFKNISQTRVLQNPWTLDNDTIPENSTIKLPLYSHSFMITTNARNSLPVRYPVKEFEVEFEDGSIQVIPARDAVGAELQPDIDDKWRPTQNADWQYRLIPGDTSSPFMTHGEMAICYVDIPATKPLGETIEIKVTAIDWIGNKSNITTKTFTVSPNYPADLTNFTHNVPEFGVMLTTVQNIRFNGARDHLGNANTIVYNILSVSPPRVIFSKPSALAQNEASTIQFTSLPTGVNAEVCIVTVQITNGFDCVSIVDIPVAVLRQEIFDFSGANADANSPFNFNIAARWKIIGTGGGGRGRNGGGGGGGTFVKFHNSSPTDSAVFSVGRNGTSTIAPSATTVTIGALSLVANPGASSVAGANAGAGGSATGGDYNYNGSNGQASGTSSGYWDTIVTGQECVKASPGVSPNWRPLGQYGGQYNTLSCVGFTPGDATSMSNAIAIAQANSLSMASQVCNSINAAPCNFRPYPADNTGTCYDVRIGSTYQNGHSMCAYSEGRIVDMGLRNVTSQVWVDTYTAAQGGLNGRGAQSETFINGFGRGGNENTDGQRGALRIRFVSLL